jgi:hypothetical protein
MSLEDELANDLKAAGYNVVRVIPLRVLPDGSEARGVITEIARLVKDLLVFSRGEMDAESAQTWLDWVLAWLRARRDRGNEDGVAFVSIYGAHGKSVLLRVPVPKEPGSSG